MKMLLGALAFRDAVLLFPAAVALHVLEEWPGFPRWARRHASPTYSDRAYLVTHAFAIGGALALALLLRVCSPPWLASLALREGLVGAPALALACGVAAVFHVLEVGHNVFARW
jgi:hypothetical protein